MLLHQNRIVMSDMFSALKNAGVIPEKVLRESEAQKQLDAEEESAQSRRDVGERERRLEILRETNSVGTFRFEAHKLLLAFPELIYEVVRFVHDERNFKSKPGGGRLIANLLALRNDLARHSKTDEDKASYIRSVLPKK